MATYTTRDGCTLHYDIVGNGPHIALTPGGRVGRKGLAPLVAELAKKARVLTWDRRNGGQSDVYFGGEKPESELWADDLADLMRAVGFGPAFIAGGSAGCRVSLLAALRHPEITKGLVIWSASGGPYACQVLGFSYHVPFILAAQQGGMAAVAQTPYFAECISANPENRNRLLAIPPKQFIETLKRWNTHYYYRPDSPVIGMTEDELRTIRVPTLVFEGNDDIHPREASRSVASLIPGAISTPSPWSGDEFIERYTSPDPTGVFNLYPRLAPKVLEFVQTH